MTTGNARTSPSLALARRIAAVGLLAGGPALTGERTSHHHRAGERGQRREGGDRRLRSRHQPAVNASRRPPVTAITAKTIRRTLLTRLVLAGVVWLGGLHGAQAGVDVWTTTGPEGGTIRALAIDPQNPATLYAAVSRNASPDSSDVYKSTDAGSNWRAVAIGLSGSPQALAIDPQTPTTLYLRAYRRVYKSTDGGGRWTLVNTSLPGSYLSTQNLVIDPQTPTTPRPSRPRRRPRPTRPRAPTAATAATGAAPGPPSTAPPPFSWSSTPRRRPPSTGAPSFAASSRARTGVPAGARSTPA